MLTPIIFGNIRQLTIPIPSLSQGPYTAVSSPSGKLYQQNVTAVR